MKVLMVMEQCNPGWPSVPLVGFNFWDAVSRLCEVVLVTHERNREAMEAVRQERVVHYVAESPALAGWYGMVHRLAGRGSVNWPLLHALSYPVYAQFNARVYSRFADSVRSGDYDVVHAMTPILPRYPVKLVRACGPTPFVLGPVNGGLPFPEGFADRARAEHARFNVLRLGARLLPGYAATYRRAAMVLAGSQYTLDMLERLFGPGRVRLELFHENGILQAPPGASRKGRAPREGTGLHAVFCGRLVPYKGADMAIEAVGRARETSGLDIRLTVVGDGATRAELEVQARGAGLGEAVAFTGWVPQGETRKHYERADVFLFPSIREFGGAVVLEAMAAGLPCVVADHGGIGEYVTPQCGVKVPPASREALVAGCAEALVRLARDAAWRGGLSAGAEARAAEYAWPRKAERLVRLYARVAGKDREGGA